MLSSERRDVLIEVFHMLGGLDGPAAQLLHGIRDDRQVWEDRLPTPPPSPGLTEQDMDGAEDWIRHETQKQGCTGEEAEGVVAHWRRGEKWRGVCEATEPGARLQADTEVRRKVGRLVSKAATKVEQIENQICRLSASLEDIENLQYGIVARSPGASTPLCAALAETLSPLWKVRDGLASLAVGTDCPAHRAPEEGLRSAARALRDRNLSFPQIAGILRDAELARPDYSGENVRDLLRAR